MAPALSANFINSAFTNPGEKALLLFHCKGSVLFISGRGLLKIGGGISYFFLDQNGIKRFFQILLSLDLLGKGYIFKALGQA